MLTLLTLAAALMQTPPEPQASPDTRSRVVIVGAGEEGRGLDRNGDGQVTRDEFSAPIADAFGRLDKDGDGRLSLDELKAGPGGPGQHDVFIMGAGAGPDVPGMRRFELSADGRVDGEVRVFTREAGPHGHGGPIVIRRGGPVVIHGDGPHLDRIERHGIDSSRGLSDMDKDGDGKVSEAEFTQPLRDAFARMDADRSGFIEEGERGGEGEVRVFARHLNWTDRPGED